MKNLEKKLLKLLTLDAIKAKRHVCRELEIELLGSGFN